MSPDPPASKGFISYVRDDNRDFNGVADRLKADLSGRFEAHTGRRLHLFVDRDDIGWGQDWRQQIQESVEAATVFIPIITMRYFASDACRSELVAFTASAQQLGVTDLVLPVIIAGADAIRADDPRAEVRLIEGLNYKNLTAAWTAGYDSPEWRIALGEMINDLSQALTRAEDTLRSQESAQLAVAGRTSPIEDRQADEDAVADASALFEQFEAVTGKAEAMSAAIEALGEATEEALSGPNQGALSPAQQKARLIRVAARISEPSRAFGAAAEELERETAKTDALLRALLRELEAIDVDAAREQLSDIRQALRAFDEMATVLEQMEELNGVLRMAALVNVSVRRAITPAIRGMQATRNAVSLAQSWKNLQ